MNNTHSNVYGNKALGFSGFGYRTLLTIPLLQLCDRGISFGNVEV